MTVRTLIRTGLGIIVVAAVLLPAPPFTDAQSPIKIGVIAPSSGPWARLGSDFRKGVDLYLSEEPSVLGRRIEVVARDSGNDAASGKREAGQLGAGKEVSAVLALSMDQATSTAVTLAAAEAKTIALGTVTSPTPVASSPHKLAFSLGVDAETWGRLAAQIVADWRIKKIAVVSSPQPSAQAAARVFVDELGRLKSPVATVHQESPAFDVVDYDQLVARQRAAGPEGVVVFAPTGREASYFLKAAERAQYFSNAPQSILIVGHPFSPEARKPSNWVTDLVRCPQCLCEYKR